VNRIGASIGLAAALALAWPLAAGCGKKGGGQRFDAAPAAAPEPAGAACADDSDCPRGTVCYLEACVDTSSREAILRQRGDVTPEKVRRELERQNQIHEQQLDRGLDMDE
jgi:hypothetical protein